MYSRTIIQGRIVKTPELRATAAGVPVTTIVVACGRNYIKNDGTRDADFYEVVLWRDLAEFAVKNFGKGRKILAEGRMQSREFVGKDGVRREKWELIADSVEFDDAKPKEEA